MKLRVLDLFSGIGGFSVGLERTGRFETTAFCEPDDYASEVLKKHWPAIPNIKCGVVGLNSLLRVRWITPAAVIYGWRWSSHWTCVSKRLSVS